MDTSQRAIDWLQNQVEFIRCWGTDDYLWHREDGPAIIAKISGQPGIRYGWAMCDKPHRVDGPAMCRPNSCEFYLHGEYYGRIENGNLIGLMMAEYCNLTGMAFDSLVKDWYAECQTKWPI